MGKRINNIKRRKKEQRDSSKLRGLRADLQIYDDASYNDLCKQEYEKLKSKADAYADKLAKELNVVFRCPNCKTCLICFKDRCGKKMHSDPCNYECGLNPSDDVFNSKERS